VMIASSRNSRSRMRGRSPSSSRRAGASLHWMTLTASCASFAQRARLGYKPEARFRPDAYAQAT
jgi:hypothetical protein